MDAAEIAWPQLAALYGSALLSAVLLRLAGLRLALDLSLSIARMSAQLGILGLYLGYLFTLNHPWITGLWIAIMLIAADITILQRAGLSLRPFALPMLGSTALGVLLAAGGLLWVIRPTPFYDARYAIPLVGMILGNCLQSNVIALERFFSAMRRNENEYLTFLLLGASREEAVRPHVRSALLASVNPAIASMATMGLVWLPGMMTGQILGGTEPWLAVKYQIAIMLSVFSSIVVTNVSTLALSVRIAFDEFDVLRPEFYPRSRTAAGAQG